MRFEYSINILLLKASEIKPGKDLLFSKKKSEWKITTKWLNNYTQENIRLCFIFAPFALVVSGLT